MRFESQPNDGDSDLLADAFYPVYRLLFGESSDFADDVETKLTEARMAETVEHYLSRALGVGVVVGGVLWLVGTLLGYSLFRFGLVDPEMISLGVPVSTGETAALLRGLVVPVTVGVTGIVFGSVGFVVGFGGLVGWPYMEAGERKRNINILLPDAISFMYALSVGGMNQLEILRAMAEAEDTYDEIAREFQSLSTKLSTSGRTTGMRSASSQSKPRASRWRSF